MQELVKAFEDLIMLKSLMQSTENLLRRQYRREQEAEAFANMRAWLNNPISYLQQALAAHKAKPALSEEELIKLLILKTTSTRYKQNTNGKCWTFVDLNTFAATLIVDIIEALRDAGVLNVRGE